MAATECYRNYGKALKYIGINHEAIPKLSLRIEVVVEGLPTLGVGYFSDVPLDCP